MGIHGKLFLYVGVIFFIIGLILRFTDNLMWGVIFNFAGVVFAFIGLLMRE